MGLFGSNKPYTCWICGRKTDDEGAFLLPQDLEEAFHGVFKDFDVKEEFIKSKICVCEICTGIMKLCADSGLQAKMKISAAASKAGSVAGTAASKVKGILSRKKD